MSCTMIWKVEWILVILFFEWSWIISAGSTPGSSTQRPSTIMKTLEKLVSSKGKICPKKLAKLCKKEPNLTEVLQEAVTLAIENCHEQFRYTRWNCTLDEKLFDAVSRETSVVTAIFSASLSHTFARSCVVGKFGKCNQTREKNFSWTEDKISKIKGPGDDMKFGRRMAKRILLGNGGRKRRRNGKGMNLMDEVSIHNVEVGLRASAKMEETCNCQNYSSRCTVQICRKSLTHLKEVVKVLRNRYTEAKMVHEADTQTVETSGRLRHPRREKNRFYYTEPSPNFCKDTHGRECNDEMNCSILCCARGFKTREIQKPKKCRCVMAGKCCNVKCQTCPGLEKKYICK